MDFHIGDVYSGGTYNWDELPNFENFSYFYTDQGRNKVIEVEPDNVLEGVEIYITVVFILIGTVGNVLTVVAVTNRHTKKTSFTVYLVSLAIVDMLALFSTTIQKWVFYIFGANFLDSTEAACRLVHYFEQLIPHISSWIIVSLTVERCLCVSFPHKTAIINRPKFSYVVVAVISAAFVFLNAHLLFGYGLFTVQSQTYCIFISTNYYNFHTFYWSWINLTVYCLLPVVIIVIANSITVLQVYRSSKLAISTTSLTSRKNRQLLLITLLVSISFIVLGMPQPLLFILRVEERDGGVDGDLLNLKYTLVYTIFNLMKTLNHAVNFFLYVLSGQRFRQQLKAAFIKTSHH